MCIRDRYRIPLILDVPTSRTSMFIYVFLLSRSQTSGHPLTKNRDIKSSPPCVHPDPSALFLNITTNFAIFLQVYCRMQKISCSEKRSNGYRNYAIGLSNISSTCLLYTSLRLRQEIAAVYEREPDCFSLEFIGIWPL